MCLPVLRCPFACVSPLANSPDTKWHRSTEACLPPKRCKLLYVQPGRRKDSRCRKTVDHTIISIVLLRFGLQTLVTEVCPFPIGSTVPAHFISRCGLFQQYLSARCWSHPVTFLTTSINMPIVHSRLACEPIRSHDNLMTP